MLQDKFCVYKASMVTGHHNFLLTSSGYGDDSDDGPRSEKMVNQVLMMVEVETCLV